ncbi:MAG: hypothetical protein IKZ87_08940 [Actinomycetaceae bacterium]|nr:hypothetical protein [Actinomycetaceae bacterium]
MQDTNDTQLPHAIEWRGRVYAPPSWDELDAMMFGDIPCTTPAGVVVDPVHPDSWPSLLKLI